jgi:hypothetical protein
LGFVVEEEAGGVLSVGVEVEDDLRDDERAEVRFRDALTLEDSDEEGVDACDFLGFTKVF